MMNRIFHSTANLFRDTLNWFQYGSVDFVAVPDSVFQTVYETGTVPHRLILQERELRTSRYGRDLLTRRAKQQHRRENPLPLESATDDFDSLRMLKGPRSRPGNVCTTPMPQAHQHPQKEKKGDGARTVLQRYDGLRADELRRLLDEGEIHIVIPNSIKIREEVKEGSRNAIVEQALEKMIKFKFPQIFSNRRENPFRQSGDVFTFSLRNYYRLVLKRIDTNHCKVIFLGSHEDYNTSKFF